MIAWDIRSKEERTLLNPAFCATLLWSAATGHKLFNSLLSVEETFLVLPLVLPEITRQSLPRDMRTSVPIWIEKNPIEQQKIAKRARATVPFTKAALLFAGVHGLLQFNGHDVVPSEQWSKGIKKLLPRTSDEVRLCTAKAEFVGKWFAKTGNSATVLALMGVRP